MGWIPPVQSLPNNLQKNPFLPAYYWRIHNLPLLSVNVTCVLQPAKIWHLNFKLTDIETIYIEIIFLAVIMMMVMDMSKISKIELQNQEIVRRIRFWPSALPATSFNMVADSLIFLKTIIHIIDITLLWARLYFLLFSICCPGSCSGHKIVPSKWISENSKFRHR